MAAIGIALGVAALIRLARRVIRAGEPAQAATFTERAARLAGGVLASADRVVYASALLQLGRLADTLAEAEKIQGSLGRTDRPAPSSSGTRPEQPVTA